MFFRGLADAIIKLALTQCAILGSPLLVIVSAANPNVFTTLDIPENVILLSARVPAEAFARLMAASSFVVVPVNPGLVRGAGEATVVNAMWHGRATICADDICAFEYVQEAVTGYVTPPGEVANLRERIIELRNDPEKAAAMGCAARQIAVADLTSEHFCRRLRALGSILAASK